MDMPLYTACPCRSKEAPYMAQCMRIYVVTPPDSLLAKAAETVSSKRNISSSDQPISSNSKLSICIKPRVQPNPNSPIFWPVSEPIQLNENCIWVLRLP